MYHFTISQCLSFANKNFLFKFEMKKKMYIYILSFIVIKTVIVIMTLLDATTLPIENRQ